MAHPALHLGERCAATGKVTRAHVDFFDIDVHLVPDAACTRRFQNDVVVLTTAPDPHPLLDAKLEGGGGRRGKVRLPVHLGAPRRLLLRWFASTTSEQDDCVAQELVAQGATVFGRGTHTVHLVDLVGQTAATVTLVVHGDNAPLAPVAALPPTPLNPVAQSLIAQMEKACAPISPMDRYISATFQLDRNVVLPALWYPLQATRITAEPAHATALFERLVHVAYTMMLPSARGVPDSMRLNQLVADTLSLMCMSWVYRDDMLYTGRTHDIWSSILAAPGPGPLAFDCEDGAKACIELFWALTRAKLVKPSALLQSVQVMARRYEPYFVMGELRSTDGSANQHVGGLGGAKYIMHAYTALFPQKGEKLPVLTVESTAFSSGVWFDGMGADGEHETHLQTRSEERAETMFPDDREYENAHVRRPMAVTFHKHFYRQVVSLMRVVPDGKAEHFLMRRVPASDLFCGRVPIPPPSVSMHTAELVQALKAELDLAPLSHLPVPLPSPSPPAPRPPQGKQWVFLPHAPSSAPYETVPLAANCTLYAVAV